MLREPPKPCGTRRAGRGGRGGLKDVEGTFQTPMADPREVHSVAVLPNKKRVARQGFAASLAVDTVPWRACRISQPGVHCWVPTILLANDN